MKNGVTRSELQLHFHPESDALTNLLFSSMDSMKNVLKNKTAGRKGSLLKLEDAKWQAQSKQRITQRKLLKAPRNDENLTIMADENSYARTNDHAWVDDKDILYRPNIELFETVEKLDAGVVLPCTVVAAVASECQYDGAQRLQSGDQIIAIDNHRTMNLKTVQGYLEGRKGSPVTITVSRALPKLADESKIVGIVRATVVRTNPDTWLSWVESTILLQNSESKKSDVSKTSATVNDSFADVMLNQQLARCEFMAGEVSFQELSRKENLSPKSMPHRYGACNGLFSMLTAATDRIKAVYRAHIVRRSIVCNFTIRQSLEEKSKGTERVLMTNGIATQQVVEWVNSGLLGVSPLHYCIENGHAEGLLQLMHYGFGTQSSWSDVLRKAKMFYSLMDSAVENKAAKASLILVQELGLLPILENSTFTQYEKAAFVMNASIKYSAVDAITNMIQNPSIMQCLGECNLQKYLSSVPVDILFKC